MSRKWNPLAVELECDLPENCMRSKFVHPLATVIDYHMRGHLGKLHSIESITEFAASQDVRVSRQAVYSALMTLRRQGVLVREYRGSYRHLASLPLDEQAVVAANLATAKRDAALKRRAARAKKLSELWGSVKQS